MAYEKIDLETPQPGGKVGEPGPTAWAKVRRMFVELYDSWTASTRALAKVTPAADKLPYFTGQEAASLTDITQLGRSVIGAADASAARTTLQLKALATQDTAAVANGGTGATSARQARTNLGLATSDVDAVPIANGGTGAASAANARSNLGAAASGVNSDITALNQASVQFGSGSQNPVASRLGGATMNYGSGLVINTTTNASTLTLGKVSTAGAFMDMYFTASSVASVGSIATNGSQTYYNTTSDYRLKKDYRPIDSPWDRVLALKPINHGWRADADLRTEGFIAHELQAVLPGAVVGEKNAVTEVGTLYDADGNVIIPETQEITDLDPGWRWEKTADRPIYQQVDLAKLVPLLTAALQEAQQRIVALEQKIGAA